MLPGNPLGNMARRFSLLPFMQRLTIPQVFKTYSVETINVCLLFVQDLKLGHYLKIPPRASFLVQLISSIICVTCQIAVKEWMFETLPDICERHQPNRLTCPRNRVFYSASAIWYVSHWEGAQKRKLTPNPCACVHRGLVGPTQLFGPTGTYRYLIFAMLIGAIAPIPFWLWQRRFPYTRLKFINLPVMLNGPTLAPPANGINYASWFIVGFIFRTYLNFIYRNISPFIDCFTCPVGFHCLGRTGLERR